MTLPWGEGEDFDGIIDLVRMKARHCNGTEAVESEIPEEYRAQAEEAHDHLCELVAEADDELMMKYLEGDADAGGARGLVVQGNRRAHLCAGLCGRLH